MKHFEDAQNLLPLGLHLLQVLDAKIFHFQAGIIADHTGVQAKRHSYCGVNNKIPIWLQWPFYFFYNYSGHLNSIL